MAAEVALVARPSQPTSAESPASSSAVTPSTPMRETGSCAPTMAQAMPSSTRYLARSRTEAGTSSSVVLATQVASRPVGPAGSVGGRAGFPVSLTATGAPITAMAFSTFQFGCLGLRLDLAPDVGAPDEYAELLGGQRLRARHLLLHGARPPDGCTGSRSSYRKGGVRKCRKQRPAVMRPDELFQMICRPGRVEISVVPERDTCTGLTGQVEICGLVVEELPHVRVQLPLDAPDVPSPGCE
jgi:hypothetical protein